MRRIGIVVVVIVLVGLAPLLHYALPQVDVVRMVGTETKRVDSAVEGQVSRDVYFIQTESLDGTRTRVYRNEDKWIYLKFDTADLQARAEALAQERAVVAVRHYGWRIPIFSAFPNALTVWKVEPGYTPIPVLTILVVLAILGILFLLRRPLLALFRGRPPADETRPRDAADDWISGDNNGGPQS